MNFAWRLLTWIRKILKYNNQILAPKCPPKWPINTKKILILKILEKIKKYSGAFTKAIRKHTKKWNYLSFLKSAMKVLDQILGKIPQTWPKNKNFQKIKNNPRHLPKP